MKDRNVYLKNDVILKCLEDYGFKLVDNDKKTCYTGNGFEIDVKTREIKSTNKSNLYILIILYNNNLLEIK